MPLQATSGAASYDAFGGGVAAVPNYIEDVFSTYLYTGNGSTQTITNGIDLAGKGGLVWIKWRSSVYGSVDHNLYDTSRGVLNRIYSNLTAAETNQPNSLTAFNSDGFSLGGTSGTNGSGANYASWTFRKQPKFFDVVTYTGDGTERTISHNLGSVPGCIIVKRTDTTSNWTVYHRELNATNAYQYYISLNLTTAKTADNIWGAAPTSTVFTVTADAKLNASGGTYVAYLFAHNAGGFGLTGTDNVISCGSFTTDGSANATVDLGYEPQLVIAKRTSNTGAWCIQDNMRGFTAKPTTYSANPILFANGSDAEIKTGANTLQATATGFTTDNISYNASSTYIYIAIRRGPMKVPTSGTSVFYPQTRTANGAITSITGIGFPPDMVWSQRRDASGNSPSAIDKLRGPKQVLLQNSTSAELTSGSTYDVSSFDQDGVTVQAQGQASVINYLSSQVANWYFQRAPSFFDEVCYTGTGSATTVTHNLGVAPELMIVKARTLGAGGYWWVYSASLLASEYLELNGTYAKNTSTTMWNDTRPTSSVFSVGTVTGVNASGQNFVAYLFATCAGVSKCTAFTGTGTLQTINCGFTAGSRFVLIKRTDAAGDWYVWDSSRGLSSSTDPYLLLNSTAAEVTSTNWVDTTSTGFQVTAASGNNVNINGASYIALAIA